MRPRIWLASYPKSGNTWTRVLLRGLFPGEGGRVDINAVDLGGGMASIRGPFDHRLLIDSSLLTQDEIDCLRPRVHEEMFEDDDVEDAEPDMLPVRFAKVHDAYTLTPDGEPLLGGSRGAHGAIVIVRDPRDVAPSLANHMHVSIDRAIAFMNRPDAAFDYATNRLTLQLRQKLLTWSGHVASWLDQRDVAVHLLRYEDMKSDTIGALSAILHFAGLEASDESVARAVDLAAFSELQEQERRSGFSEWRDRTSGGRKFFRRGEAGAWRDELTAEQVARIERDHGPMMERLGYALSPADAGKDAR